MVSRLTQTGGGPSTLGKEIWQAASRSPFTILLATLKRPPKRPPLFGLGSFPHGPSPSLTFTNVTSTSSSSSPSGVGSFILIVGYADKSVS